MSLMLQIHKVFRSTRCLIGGVLLLLSIMMATVSVASIQIIKTPVTPAPGTKWAVIIAIEKYKDKTLRSLTTDWKESGQDVKQLLQQDYGYRSDNIFESYDNAATSSGIYRLFSSIRERISPKDTLVVFIFGHWVGAELSGSTFVPADGTLDEPWTYISFAEIQEMLKSTKAAATLAVIERCPDKYQRKHVSNLFKQYTLSTFKGNKSKKAIRAEGHLQLLTGCGSSIGNRGDFATRVVEVLSDWRPDNPGNRLTVSQLRRLIGQSRRVFDVQQQDAGSSRYEQFSFIREYLVLDPSLVSTIQDREASEDTRVDAMITLAEPLALDPNDDNLGLRQQAARLLTDLFQDGTEVEAVREAAIYIAGELEIPSVVVAFEQLLLDSEQPGYIKSAAVDSLGGPDNPSALRILQSAVSNQNAGVRTDAITRLMYLQSIDSLPYILDQLQRETAPSAILASLEAIEILGAPANQATHIVLSVLQRPPENSDVRRAAIRLLGVLGDSQALQSLTEAMQHDDDVRVRQAAAYALARLDLSQDQREGVTASLISALSNEPGNSVRRAVIVSLGRLESVEAIEPLINILVNEQDIHLRTAAANSLGQIGAEAATDPLISVLQDDNPDLRRAAVNSLGNIGNPMAIPHLNRMLSDPNSYVRNAASESLDKVETSDESIELWAQAIRSDQNPANRVAAVRRLPSKDDARIIDLLIETFADDDYHVRQTALDKLVSIPGMLVVAKLENALGHERAITREGAAVALGALGQFRERESPEWTAALEILLGHPDDYDLRTYAAIVRSLGNYTDERSAKALIEYTDDSSVQYAAVNALRALAENYYRLGDSRVAIKLGNVAYRKRSEYFGHVNPDVATDLNNLAVYHQQLQEFDDAEYYLREALSIQEIALGSDHPAVATSLTNLAFLYATRAKKNDIDRAEGLYFRALTIRERTLGHYDIAVAQSLENLARLYADSGRTGEAEKYLARAKAIRSANEKRAPKSPTNLSVR